MDAVYSGIDLHSTNSVVAVIDSTGQLLYRRRLPNEQWSRRSIGTGWSTA